MKKDDAPISEEVTYVWSGHGISRVAEPHVPSPSFKKHTPYSEPSPEEQRLYPRLDLKLPILYRPIGKNGSAGTFALAQSANLSPLGICLELPERYLQGTRLALSIHFLENREKFDALASVVWTQNIEGTGRTLTGLQFVVTDGDRVKNDGHRRLRDLLQKMSKPL